MCEPNKIHSSNGRLFTELADALVGSPIETVDAVATALGRRFYRFDTAVFVANTRHTLIEIDVYIVEDDKPVLDLFDPAAKVEIVDGPNDTVTVRGYLTARELVALGFDDHIAVYTVKEVTI